MSASAPKSTTDTDPELQLTEEERELLSIRTVPEFEAAQAARRRAKALAKAPRKPPCHRAPRPQNQPYPG